MIRLAGGEGPVPRAKHAVELWGDHTLVVFGGEGEGGEEEEGTEFTLLGDLWALNLTAAFAVDGTTTQVRERFYFAFFFVEVIRISHCQAC